MKNRKIRKKKEERKGKILNCESSITFISFFFFIVYITKFIIEW